jgi:anaerobic selenocysteine-containing dehydrogenase
MADEVVLTTCPRDCYDACGIVVLKRDGAIRHVRGDPAHPVSRAAGCAASARSATTAHFSIPKSV